MPKKKLTAREARKRKQTLATVWGVIGGVVAASALVGVFIFTQGDSLKEAPKDYEASFDSNIEVVPTDGSDPNQEGTLNEGLLTLDKDIPKLIKTPRYAWDSMTKTAMNLSADKTMANEELNYLWKLENSSSNTAEFVTNDTKNQCKIVFSNNALDGDFSNDKEATEKAVGTKDYVVKGDVSLWTSYNLRVFYQVNFAEVQPTDNNILLTRASAENKVVFTADVSCADGTDEKVLNKAVDDATNIAIIISPIEVGNDDKVSTTPTK